MSTPAGTPRRTVVVADGDELRADPTLLTAYCATFGADDDITLAVAATDTAEVERVLVATLTEAGVDLDTCCDILVLAGDGEPVAHVVLTDRPVRPEIAHLPSFGCADLPQLRARVDRIASLPRRRALLAVERFHPAVGGTERLAEGIAVALQADGWDVEVATPPRPERTLWHHCGVAIHDVDGDAPAALEKLVDARGIDAVVAFSYPTSWPVRTTLALPARPDLLRLVVPCVNEQSYRTAHDTAGFVETFRALAAMTEVGYSSTSGWDARLLRDAGIEGIYLPNAVEDVAPAPAFRERHGIGDDERLLVMVANFWPEKNHLALLETFAGWSTPCRLVVLGGPSEHYPELAADIERAAHADARVLLVQDADRCEVAAAMAAGDLLLLPSLAEATPLVLLEAMAKGLPWLCTPTCGSAGELPGGLVRPLAEFGTTVDELLADAGRLAELGAAGRDAWEQRYSWEVVGARYRAVLDGRSVEPPAQSELPPDATVVLLGERVEALETQLAALSGEAAEIVVVDDGRGLDTSALEAAHSVRVIRHAQPTGRAASLREAASLAAADVCVVLAPTSCPRPGLLAPLVAAARSGALAAPVVGTPAGPVHGYTLAADGSLWPLAEGDDRPLQALGVDCLAAPRAFFELALPDFAIGEGHWEPQVAAAAGRLAIAVDARVDRVTDAPAASVVVCTHNRSDEIGPCLDALAAHGATRDGCEVVVVANACTDDTAEVVRERIARYGPSIRLVEEPVSGLSQARNTGGHAASNPVLAYLDDDARPAPGWLEAVREAFRDPGIAIAGGPIAGLFPPEHRAGWPGRNLQGYLTILDRGDRDEVTDTGDAYGANLAVRRSTFEAAGGFDPVWGEASGSAIVGDDSEFCARVARLELGRSAYPVAACVGHRISLDRVSDRWLARRVYRHGLILPSSRAGFVEPALEDVQALGAEAASDLHQLGMLSGTLTVPQALAAILRTQQPLEKRMGAACALGAVVAAVHAAGGSRCTVGAVEIQVSPEAAAGFIDVPAGPDAARQADRRHDGRLPILAIVPAFNEADVIEHTVGNLIADGIDVYLLDNGSTDGTADRVRHLLGHGLVHIERFPDDAGYPQRDAFVLKDQLRRFEEIAAEHCDSWVLIADADEFRESPFPGTSLREGIELVDRLGFDAVDFALFNFRPTDDRFVPGTDVRLHLTAYETGAAYDAGQIKAWRTSGPVDLSDLFGIGASFPGRRVFPVPFILRHYPIRSDEHGRRKVLRERLPRFAPEEKADGWHVQYDAFEDVPSFLWSPSDLIEWDGATVRAGLLARASVDLLRALTIRTIDLAAVEPDPATALGWLAAAAPGSVPERALQVAHQLAQQRGAGVDLNTLPPGFRDEPGLLEACRLLAGECLLQGNPVARRRFDDVIAWLLAPTASVVALPVDEQLDERAA